MLVGGRVRVEEGVDGGEEARRIVDHDEVARPRHRDERAAQALSLDAAVWWLDAPDLG